MSLPKKETPQRSSKRLIFMRTEENPPEGCLRGGPVGLLVLVKEDLVALHHHAHAVPGPAQQTLQSGRMFGIDKRQDHVYLISSGSVLRI